MSNKISIKDVIFALIDVVNYYNVGDYQEMIETWFSNNMPIQKYRKVVEEKVLSEELTILFYDINNDMEIISTNFKKKVAKNLDKDNIVTLLVDKIIYFTEIDIIKSEINKMRKESWNLTVAVDEYYSNVKKFELTKINK